VRRVVEARRVAKEGGAAVQPVRTAVLPPPGEKEDGSESAPGEKGETAKTRFWRKLKCW